MTGKIVKKTESICPKCLKKISAEVTEKDNKIYLKKKCDEHGYFEDLHVLNYPKMYYLMENLHKKNKMDYVPEGLKIYVTRRCNMYCNFCFERAGDIELKEPSLEDIKKWISEFKGSSIYLQGGEPTLRKDILEIIKLIKKNGFYAVLFTNGKKLSDEEYVKSLKRAGLDYVILSLDSLKKESNIQIHGDDILGEKLDAIKNLNKNKIYTGIFMKLVKNLNEHEIPDMINFCSENKSVKTLFLSSVWKSGRLDDDEQVLFKDVFDTMEKKSGINFKVTEDSSRFAHHLFEIMQILGMHKGHKEPMCSTNTYLVRIKEEFVPLNEIVDIEKLIPKLEDIKYGLKGNRMKKINSFLSLSFMITRLFLNPKFIKVFTSSLKNNLGNIIKGKRLSFMFLEVFSIVVGVFHNKYNLDLDATRTCNMHAVIPETGEIVPQCVRQMMVEKEVCDGKIKKN